MTLDEQVRAILESNLTEIKPEIIDHIHGRISNIVCMSYANGFWDGHKKASEETSTEQEPFINKPCVSQGICHEDKVKVLEDIKAELKRMADNEWNQQVGSSKGLEEAIEVVEKYID